MFQHLKKKFCRRMLRNKVSIFLLPTPGESKYKRYFYLKKGDRVDICTYDYGCVEVVFCKINKDRIKVKPINRIPTKFESCHYLKIGKLYKSNFLSIFLEEIYGIDKVK